MVGEGSPKSGADGIAGGTPSPPTIPGKSCKGCLYYSSLLESEGSNPRCFGISRTLPQVPSYMHGESEDEAMKEGRNLKDFKYGCVGYSVFLDTKNSDKQEEQTELPFCLGIELLVDRRASTADHVPAPVHREEDVARPQPRAYKPAPSTGEEFLGRFSRSAGLVASGVARNLHRVASYVKENIDDILYPYRRRPK